MPNLQGRVALVTGASRGVGKGIAIALVQAGATVFATARTAVGRNPKLPMLPGSLEDVALECVEGPGKIIGLQCDHTDDEQTRRVMEEIKERAGHLDILVNSMWAGYEGLHIFDERGRTWASPFWEQPVQMYDDMMNSVRAHYVTTQLAVPLMLSGRSKDGASSSPGLIVNVSFFAGSVHRDQENVPYHLAKNADDKMALAFAHQLKDKHISSLSLYPGLVKTEGVLNTPPGIFDLSNSESPLFVGRAVAALARDPKIMERTGEIVVGAEVGVEYGFTDVDGKQPRSIRESFGLD